MKDIEILETNNRKIVIKGIGRMFYQNGFPVSMAISKFRESGIEVSILHVADELLKQGDFGMDRKTGEFRCYSLLKDQLEDCAIDGIDTRADVAMVYLFCWSSYEQQREMIFNYLWKDVNAAKDFFKQQVLINTLK